MIPDFPNPDDPNSDPNPGDSSADFPNPDDPGSEDRVRQELAKLAKDGWQAELPPAIEKQYGFASYGDTLNFLIEMGAAAEEIGTMPSVCIDDGTDVQVRIGHPPVPVLTLADVELAKALPA